MFFVFAGWDMAHWFFDAVPHLGEVACMPSVFSEYTSWLPLACRVAEGNLFPVLSAIDGSAQGVGIYPYFSIWAHGLLIACFGLEGSYFVGRALIPVFCYLVLYRILRRNLPKRWSVAIGAVGLISFASLPFRTFILGLLSGKDWVELGTIQPLEIAHFPVPSFSLLAFLITFLLSIQNRYWTLRRISFLTAIWALQSQIHLINAIFGLVFWFCSFPIRLGRQNRDTSLGKQLVWVTGQGLIALIFLSPTILSYGYLLWSGMLELSSLDLGLSHYPSHFGPLYYVLYFLLPVLLVVVAYFTHRVDPYELLYKFWPVFVLLLTEVMMITAHHFSIFAISPDLTYKRLGIFFLHFYYFIPAVYYLGRPSLNFTSGIEASWLMTTIRRAFFWFFHHASKIYIPLVMVLLTLFASASIVASVRHSVSVKKPLLEEAWNQLQHLTADINKSQRQCLVSDNPAVNLLLPMVTSFSTLWVDRFSNRVGTTEIATRLALHARLFDWSEDRFVEFMSPGVLQSHEEGNAIQLHKDDIQKMGVGYWLAMHRSNLATPELKNAYEMNLREIYRNARIVDLLHRFGVSRVHAEGSIAVDNIFDDIIKTPHGTYYFLNNSAK
jgi:hypothetical protein